MDVNILEKMEQNNSQLVEIDNNLEVKILVKKA